MTDAQLVGLVLIAAMGSPFLLLAPRIVRAWREYRRLCRTVADEWDALLTDVDALRADIDRATPVALLAVEMAARADAEAERLAPDMVAELETYLEEHSR